MSREDFEIADTLLILLKLFLKMKVNWPAIGACILPNVGGWAVAIYAVDNVRTWYTALKKPPCILPDWVYGPTWTFLYTSMGYASYLIWRDCGKTFRGRAAVPLGLYASQLALNWALTPIFFKAHKLKLSLIDISLCVVNVAACGIAFYQVNKTAGLLFAPYFVWMSLATSSIYYIYKNNEENTKRN